MDDVLSGIWGVVIALDFFDIPATIRCNWWVAYIIMTTWATADHLATF